MPNVAQTVAIDDAQAYITLLNDLTTTRYLVLGATVMLVWDTIATLDIEIERVWRGRKTFGTTLFFLNRYLPLFTMFYNIYYDFLPNPSSAFCKAFEMTFFALSFFSVALISCILIMRTNALYRSRQLLLFLYFLGILSLSNMLACFLVIYHNTTWVTQSPFGSTHCASECSSSTCVAAQTLFWIPFSLLETFLALLTMWKYYCNCQRRRSLDRSLVVATVARDGIVYYFVIIGLCILNIILWVAVQSHSYSFLAIAIMKSLQSTICSRMLLNIRGLLEKSTFDDTATRISIHPNNSQVVVTREGTLLHLTSVRSSVDLDDRTRHDYGYERGLQ